MNGILLLVVTTAMGQRSSGTCFCYNEEGQRGPCGPAFSQCAPAPLSNRPGFHISDLVRKHVVLGLGPGAHVGTSSIHIWLVINRLAKKTIRLHLFSMKCMDCIIISSPTMSLRRVCPVTVEWSAIASPGISYTGLTWCVCPSKTFFVFSSLGFGNMFSVVVYNSFLTYLFLLSLQLIYLHSYTNNVSSHKKHWLSRNVSVARPFLEWSRALWQGRHLHGQHNGGGRSAETCLSGLVQ